jgi:hypothetical protein
MATLVEQIAIDTQAVADAHAALSASQAALGASQAALLAVAPQKSILDKIEEEAGTLEQAFGDSLRASVNDLRALIGL